MAETTPEPRDSSPAQTEPGTTQRDGVEPSGTRAATPAPGTSESDVVMTEDRRWLFVGLAAVLVVVVLVGVLIASLA